MVRNIIGAHRTCLPCHIGTTPVSDFVPSTQSGPSWMHSYRWRTRSTTTYHASAPRGQARRFLILLRPSIAAILLPQIATRPSTFNLYCCSSRQLLQQDSLYSVYTSRLEFYAVYKTPLASPMRARVERPVPWIVRVPPTLVHLPPFVTRVYVQNLSTVFLASSFGPLAASGPLRSTSFSTLCTSLSPFPLPFLSLCLYQSFQ